MNKFPSAPTFDLSGKSALVAGASSGIGIACAAAMAQSGANVTLAARSEIKLAELADDMAKENWKANVLPLDLCDVDQLSRTVEESGPYDILVNSAGLARHAPAVNTTVKDYDAVMNTNLRGAFFLTQAVARGLLDAGKPGSLINISSQMAHVGGQERAVYCASKHGVEGFTKAMAIELGPAKIRVNTICPTFILTPLTQSTFDDPDKRAWILDKIKLGRAGEVEDITGAVIYLASDASTMVTGTSMMVDGGWTAD